MRTRSKSYPFNSTATIPRRSNRRRIPNIVEPEIRTIEEVVLMADRTMKSYSRHPRKGMEKLSDVLNDAIKLMLFSYSLEGAARIWYEKEPPNSILTWDDLVNKFVNQFFPPSKTTHLKNKISRFTQRFEETFGEAWDRFKEMLRACPHHGFSKLTQIDRFYNGLTEQDQDSLNAVTGDKLLNKTTREALKIIENKSKVRYSRSKSNDSRVNTNSKDNVGKTNNRIDKLADQILNLVEIVNKQVITYDSTKVVEKTCVTCGGAHAYYDCISTDSNQPSVCTVIGSYNQVSSPNQASHQIPPPGFAPASTSGTLLGNTVPNPKGEMKVVTTRSGLAYEGPSIPTNSPLEKVDEQNTEETMDKEHSNCPGSTAQVQPLVLPISILKPDVPRTQSKPTIPYPSRLNDQKLRKKATNQMEKFFQIFRDLQFNISFADALLLMPKFASTIKSLLTNKDKLFELAKFPLNENCSAMLLKKLPEKLGDLELTPTRMTLELADRSITHPKGVAKDVFVKVGKFHFPTDFMVVDFEANIRVPLILGRSFLRTGRALIDVYGEEITLRYNAKSRNPTLVSDPLIPENDFKEIEDFLNDDLIPTGIENSGYDPDGDILFLKKLLNEDPFQLPSMDLKLAEESKAKSSVEEPPELELKDLPSHLEYDFLEDSNKLPVIIAKDLEDVKKEALIKVLKSNKRAIAWKIFNIKGIDPRFRTHKILIEEDYKLVVQIQRRVNPKIHDVIKKEVIKLLDAGYRKLNDATRKDHFSLPFMDQMLERLARNEFYCFLDGCSGYLQIPIDPQDQEKTTFTCPYGTFAYRRMPFGLCNAPGTFQRCMMAISHDMIEKTMEVFMDDFSVFGDSFSSCLTNLDKMLKRCEETNLVLNWEKCHFMCREGIVLGHKISKSGIEIDRPKVNVITKLPHPTTVKGVRSFLGHAGFYRRFIQDFSKIARPMTHLLEKETPFVFSKECVDAFNTLKKKLTEAPWLQKGSENLAADHLSRLKNPHKDVLENKDIYENFPLETLGSLSSNSTPWFADIENFHAGNFIKKGLTSQQKKKFFKAFDILKDCHEGPTGGHHGANITSKKSNDQVWGNTSSSHSLSSLDEWSSRGFQSWIETYFREDGWGKPSLVLVYGKSCHLPIELEHRAYWALKHVNFDLKTASDYQKLQPNDLSELREQAYENSVIYKKRTKKLHDSNIKNRISMLVFSYGTIELSQPNGPYFKVNGHRVKHYFGGDIPFNVVPDLHTFPMDK
nr:DNA-directed DNA polymerase [Tanacetum cinerariifolium]